MAVWLWQFFGVQLFQIRPRGGVILFPGTGRAEIDQPDRRRTPALFSVQKQMNPRHITVRVLHQQGRQTVNGFCHLKAPEKIDRDRAAADQNQP